MRALKKLKSQLALEDPDLLAQRRLRDMQARGRATEMKLFSDCHEIPQLADIHCRKMSRNHPRGHPTTSSRI
jgi:hypothetical protein